VHDHELGVGIPGTLATDQRLVVKLQRGLRLRHGILELPGVVQHAGLGQVVLELLVQRQGLSQRSLTFVEAPLHQEVGTPGTQQARE